jgi:hypothetical protein
MAHKRASAHEPPSLATVIRIAGKMKLVPPKPGHPPLDFSLVGLAKPRGPNWVIFFEGEHEKPVWSVLLAHSAGDNGLVVVKTAPRQRWDRDMAGEVEAEDGHGGSGATDFAFGLLLWMIDSGRPALEGEAALSGDDRAAYNRGLVTFAEDHGAEWETWEPARWTLGERNIEARVFRFAHAWAGFSVDDPDRYVGVTAYNVADTTVRLDEIDGASYNFDFTKSFGIEDLQAQVGSRPDVESIIRAPARYPGHRVVIATPSRVISEPGPRPSRRL